MRYYPSLILKGLQSYRSLNFDFISTQIIPIHSAYLVAICKQTSMAVLCNDINGKPGKLYAHYVRANEKKGPNLHCSTSKLYYVDAAAPDVSV